MSIAPAQLLRTALPALALAFAGNAAADDGLALVRSNCSGCHLEHDGRFERISAIRKTPEGWSMTLFRMKNVHGLRLSEDAESGIVHYLADTQGLAPAEAEEARFALERRPNVKDLVRDPELTVACGRCHSLARAALQRRDADEWRKLAHTHIGQWPSLEYQATSRDRPWWQIASEQLPAKLGAAYPFESAAWSAWRARPTADASGSWVVYGHEPGGRDLFGTAQITSDGKGGYQARYQLHDQTGAAVAGESHATVYTGYEWRGRGTLGGRAAREIYALGADGKRLTGRWFDPEHAEEGGDFTAVRSDGPPEVLAVLPRALKAGTTATVTIVGNGLAGGGAAFGAGVSARVVAETAATTVATLTVAADAAPGARTVAKGAASANGAFVVYRQVDRLDVRPGYGIARLGGGKLAPVTAQFEAIGETRLADGTFVSLGPLPAAWSVRPYDEEAKRTDDPKYAGRLEANGRFMPAGAGPNREREYSGNNVGNLSIVARVDDGARPLEGAGHLIVTVQRWNNPPIY